MIKKIQEIKIRTETLPWDRRLLARTKDQVPPWLHLHCWPKENGKITNIIVQK